MSTLDKIRAERKEAREREKINFLYGQYDQAHLDERPDGSVLRFVWEPEGAEHPYTYAALLVAKRWFVTGRESPNGLASEDFIAWLIGKDIAVEDLEWLVPDE